MRLIFMNKGACLYVEYQHMVRLTFGINAFNKFMSKRNRRRTKIHRNSQKFIDIFFTMVNTLDAAIFIRNADNDDSPVGICKSAHMVRKILRSNVYALAVKSLGFFHGENIFYTHWASRFMLLYNGCKRIRKRGRDTC